MQFKIRMGITLIPCIAILCACNPDGRARVSESASDGNNSSPEASPVVLTNQDTPEPVGVTVDDAIIQIAAICNDACPGNHGDYPLDLDPFADLSGTRTSLDRYLEERLIEVLSKDSFVVVPRPDEVVRLNRLISQSRQGQVALTDRLEFGKQRSAKLLVKTQTTRFPSHLEAFFRVYGIENGQLVSSRHVEVAWNSNLRELDKVRLVLADELDNPTLAASVSAGAQVAIEGEPLALEYRLLAFEPSGISNRVVPRSEPLLDGGSLRSDDAFAIQFRTSQDCYVYAFLLSSDGSASTIFPHRDIELSNRVTGGSWHRVPDANRGGQSNQYQLDDVVGIETVYLVASEEPLDNLAEIARLLGPPEQGGSKGDLSTRLVDKMRTGDKSSWLKRSYVARPGAKGIRPNLVASDSDEAPEGGHSSPEGSAVERLESMGLVTKVVKIRHIGR